MMAVKEPLPDRFDLRTEMMPDAMRLLLLDYPRETWEAHPGFHDATRHWLEAHQWFRRLANILRKETELYLDRSRAAEDYAARLAYHGDSLVRHLHGHHGWEDHVYFPSLSAADRRFDAGLAILEKDHEALDQVLEHFVDTANLAIGRIQAWDKSARDAAGDLHGTVETIEAFFERHLGDEEDLTVPIILHHRLRG